MSGAETGIKCGLRASGATVDCRSVWTPCWNVEGAISVSGDLIMGQGDSGGPLFSLTGDGRGDIARGLVSSGPPDFLWVPCFDPITGLDSGRYCSNAVWFTDILSAIAPWAASGMYVKTA